MNLSYVRNILCLSNRDETSISNNSILLWVYACPLKWFWSTLPQQKWFRREITSRISLSLSLFNLFLQQNHHICVYMSANHLVDKTEKANGNAFEIPNEKKRPHGNRKKRDCDSVMMMDSTIIYFHGIECAEIMRCGFFRYNTKIRFPFPFTIFFCCVVYELFWTCKFLLWVEWLATSAEGIKSELVSQAHAAWNRTFRQVKCECIWCTNTHAHTPPHFLNGELKVSTVCTLCICCMSMENGMNMVLLLLLQSFTIQISDRKFFKRICVKILYKQRHKKVP